MAEEDEGQQTLLGNVPDDALHNFEQEEEKNEEPKATMPSFMGKTRSTGDALWNMAAQMREMQDHPNESFHAVDKDMMSPGDMMLEQQGKELLRRGRSNSRETESMKQEETKASKSYKSDPQAKRKMLRQATLGANTKKDDDEPQQPPPDDADVEAGERGHENNNKYCGCRRKSTRTKKVKDNFRAEMHDFEEWYRFRRPDMRRFVKTVMLWLILPSTAVAVLLFYGAGNPPCGTRDDCIESQKIILPGSPTWSPTLAPTILLEPNETLAPTSTPSGDDSPFRFFTPDKTNRASVSWWILFLGVRQVITFTLAKSFQALVIDFLALRKRWFIRLFGPCVTLIIVQSRGWPFILLFWALFDFALLYGDTRFARHW